MDLKNVDRLFKFSDDRSDAFPQHFLLWRNEKVFIYSREIQLRSIYKLNKLFLHLCISVETFNEIMRLHIHYYTIIIRFYKNKKFQYF